ncbi:helix-turn-helix transcriptional regulator [Komagataeibacter sp. FNDCR2]|uniref:helix-turn-helix transcriptional regulator n=1 Tax=Komagataeibacter sp. FNDCR2 TaxID=2878682 RepID=UPI001E3C85F6|nr:helix-turn-helix transcriptional regulator [Komagataeibacter sp. FNDCR2]MCE2574841.1 helix-turn-helix transcriptional regulator [Komagataeibacter sp. FNDCR2]
MSIGSRMREARLKLGLGQAAVAAEIGVSIPTVSEWERGKKLPSEDKWESIAAFLRAPMEEIFILDDEEKYNKIKYRKKKRTRLYPSDSISNDYSFIAKMLANACGIQRDLENELFEELEKEYGDSLSPHIKKIISLMKNIQEFGKTFTEEVAINEAQENGEEDKFA